MKNKKVKQYFRCMCCNEKKDTDLGLFIRVRKGKCKADEWYVCQWEKCISDAENGIVDSDK